MARRKILVRLTWMIVLGSKNFKIRLFYYRFRWAQLGRTLIKKTKFI